MPEDITLFSAVDRTKEPDFFRRFLDEGNKLPGIVASKPIILAGLQLAGGRLSIFDFDWETQFHR